MKLNYSQIRKKVQTLVRQHKTTKTKLGLILKSNKNKDEHNRVSYTRGSRFLSGSGKISTESLQKIADFFDKPLIYFLQEADVPNTLRMISEIKNAPEADLDIMKGLLKKRGIDDKKIQEILVMIKDW